MKDAAKEETEARRADVTIRNLEHERESLLAATRVKVAAERQRSASGVQKATRDAEAQVAGIQAQIEAEKQCIEMVRAKYTAELLAPAEAEKTRRSLEAQAKMATLKGRSQAEIDQLNHTVDMLQKDGPGALQAYLIEHFEECMEPFAQTLDLFPVEPATVLSGAGDSHQLLCVATGAGGNNALAHHPLAHIPHSLGGRLTYFPQGIFRTDDEPSRVMS